MDSKNLIGRQIDQYRILSHIARGGMADVYLAEDVNLERKVALKIMLDALAAADPQFAARFRREAITAAKLDHPNIVQVYTVGQTPAGQPYIAMQFITGGSLREKLQTLAERNKLLTTEQALNITRQIAGALAAAHNAGVIHRDLKPDNVLIRPDGQPVLADLGLAVVAGGSKLTQTGVLIGTPYYVPPEQIQGKSLDGRADLYSLGVILYEMLAGRRPFEENDYTAVLHGHLHEAPPPLEKICPALAPQTINLVETALQKEPAHRYPRAEEMILAIDRALQAEGAPEPNPQATRVLATLEDELLVNRPLPIYTPPENDPPSPVSLPTETAPPPRRKIPLWIIATALTLGALPLFFLLLNVSDGGIDATAIPFAATPTAVAQLETVSATASVTETPVLPPPTADRAAAAQEIAAVTAAPPTGTPLPSPTPELTVTPTAAPTNTLPPIVAPASVTTPSPTPCSLAVYPPFAAAWNAHAGQLNCPTANGRGGINMALEDFSGGRMVWRKDIRQIYVLYNNKQWAAYADAWRSGDPEYSCGTPQSPPTPMRGFGKIWCDYDVVRAGLGDAVNAEWSVIGAVQEFAGGFILQPDDTQVYVFYNNGTWR